MSEQTAIALSLGADLLRGDYRRITGTGTARLAAIGADILRVFPDPVIDNVKPITE